MEKMMRASEFKAKCLAIMDEVRDKHTTVIITKNGKPVAQMVPILDKSRPDPIFGFLRDKVRIVGDITAPFYTDAEYEAFFEQEAAKYSSAEAKGE